MTQDERLTIKQAARELEVDERTVRRWIKSDQLKASLDVIGRYRITREDLDDFVRRRTQRPIDGDE